MSGTNPPDLTDLLAHAAWLRTLALQISRQPDLADDAVQLTWESALRSPPDPDRSPRPWLAQVVRNFLNKRHRSEGRRGAHEAKAAFEGETWVESAETMEEKAEAYRLLTQLVANLDERRRTIVLLRYCEEKTASQIGAQLELPAGTVRRMLKEAREQLAQQMDEAYRGQRNVWLGAFVPLGPAPLLPLAKVSKVAASSRLTRWGWALSGLAVIATAVVLVSSQAGRSTGVLQVASSLKTTPLDFVAEAEDQLGELTVKVTNAQNAPVANAVVLLLCKQGCDVHIPSSPKTTNVDGVVSFTNLTAGQYQVVAHAPKHGSARDQIDIAQSPLQHPLRLAPAKGAFALSGTVSDDGGGVVAGAIVTATLNSMVVGISTTNDKGEYELSLDKGMHHVAAQADGYAPRDVTISIDGSSTYNVNLTAAAHISGLVLRANDGAPVAGALVSLKSQMRDLKLRTDTRGRFESHQVPADRYVITAQDGELWGTAAVSGRLVAGQSIDVVRIELGHTPSVSVHVVDSGGKPVAEADIRMEPMPYDSPAMVMEGKQMGPADASGTLELRGLPSGRYMLRAGKDGYAWSIKTFALDKDSVALKFQLSPEVRVLGRVVDVEGKPVAKARVSLTTRAAQDRDAAWTGSSMRTTDDQGRFDADQLGEGWLSVEVSHEKHGALEKQGVPVKLGDTKNLQLQFAAPIFVTGQVLWDDNKPAANVIVQWIFGPLMPRTRTDAEGNFRLGPLSPGEGGIAARALEDDGLSCCGPPNTMALQLKAGVAPEPVKLILERLEHQISGTTVSAEGHPLAGVTVYAASHAGATGFALTHSPHASSDAQGRFVIDNLPGREYALIAQAPGYGQTVVKAHSASSKAVSMRLERSGGVQGVLVDENGKPVPVFEVAAVATIEKVMPEHLVFGSPQTEFQKVSQSSGQFQITDLEAGHHDVLARLPDGRVGVAPRVRVGRAETTKLRLVAGPAGVAKGRLIDAHTGKGLANIGLEVSMREGLVHARSEADGRFEIGGLFPGCTSIVSVRAMEGHVPETFAVKTPSGQKRIELAPWPLLPLPKMPDRSGPPGHPGLRLEVATIGGAIDEVMPGSSAAQAGIELGGRLMTVDGVDVSKLGAQTVNSLLIGKAGTKVKVQVLSASGQLQTHELLRTPPPGPHH